MGLRSFVGLVARRSWPGHVAPAVQQQSECMFQSVQPASGRAFVSKFPVRSDGESGVPGGTGFQVPVNLSAEEIREIVRELMG